MQLSHEKSSVRDDAIKELIKAGEGAVPHLIQALNSGESQVQIGAAKVLEKTANHAAIPALNEGLSNPETSVRISCARALDRLIPPEARTESQWRGIVVSRFHSGKSSKSTLNELLDANISSDLAEEMITVAIKDTRSYFLKQIGQGVGAIVVGAIIAAVCIILTIVIYNSGWIVFIVVMGAIFGLLCVLVGIGMIFQSLYILIRTLF